MIARSALIPELKRQFWIIRSGSSTIASSAKAGLPSSQIECQPSASLTWTMLRMSPANGRPALFHLVCPMAAA